MTDKISLSREQVEKCLRDALIIRFSTDSHVEALRAALSNQSAPADKECAHRFMSLADDPRRCADCDAVEMHDKPVVRLELVRSGLSEGLHIRVWENLGNLWPGVHMLYLGPAAQPAPVAVVMPERKTVKAGLLSESNTHNQGWNACLDEVARLNPIKQ
jgi:hypothetical protein